MVGVGAGENHEFRPAGELKRRIDKARSRHGVCLVSRDRGLYVQVDMVMEFSVDQIDLAVPAVPDDLGAPDL